MKAIRLGVAGAVLLVIADPQARSGVFAGWSLPVAVTLAAIWVAWAWGKVDPK